MTYYNNIVETANYIKKYFNESIDYAVVLGSGITLELEDQQELGHILQDNSNKPIKIKIGSENQMEALSDMSLIQTDFSQDNNQLGTLAILGPTRMEYSRIINMLSYMKHLMETMARNQT